MSSDRPGRRRGALARSASSSSRRATRWTTRAPRRRRLEAAFAAGDLVRTPFLDQALGDLATALDQEDGQRLGGKSAEASRFILRAVDRALDDA